MNTTQHPLLFARATRHARVLQYGAEVQDAVSGVVVAIDATTGIAHLLTGTGEVHVYCLNLLRFNTEAVRKVAEKADERAIATEAAS